MVLTDMPHLSNKMVGESAESPRIGTSNSDGMEERQRSSSNGEKQSDDMSFSKELQTSGTRNGVERSKL